MKKHGAKMGVEAAGGIAGEDADFLQPIERPLAAAVGRHQPEEAGGAGWPDDLPERVVDLAASRRGQGFLHDADAGRHGEELFDVALAEDQKLAHSSLCTVSGEKAGSQTAMYSAPSSPGV